MWWLAGRSAGLVAMLLITASVILGLAMSARVVPRRWRRDAATVHQHLALIALGAIAAHGLLLAAGRVDDRDRFHGAPACGLENQLVRPGAHHPRHVVDLEYLGQQLGAVALGDATGLIDAGQIAHLVSCRSRQLACEKFALITPAAGCGRRAGVLPRARAWRSTNKNRTGSALASSA